jgi:LacI family transcriptional regulator
VRDVARAAGVSQPTASLVLGNHPTARVAPATRERVLAAAGALGYRPNVMARGLARGRSFALGVIVPDLRNQFFADVVSGAERVAGAAGYALLLCGAAERSAGAHLDTLASRQIDGIIIDAVNAAALDVDALAGMNVVLVDEPSERWPGVASDALDAGRQAAEHLLALGHRRLAFIGPAVDVHAYRMRERGFVQRLREAGLRLPSAMLRRAPGTVRGGDEAMRALLAERSRPTAVFCANDLIALGALKRCAAARARVPEDISLVGCDDIEMARLVTPELTTVSIPARELGARAARLLVRQLAGETPRPGAALLPVKLVARGTTGAPPAEVSA